MELAECLGKLSETEPTANALLTRSGAFASTWRQNQTLRTGGPGIRIPGPRTKALHPQACEIIDAELAFIFTLGDRIDEMPMPAQSDFQVRVRGYAEYQAASVELEDHWRVDTDLVADGKSLEPHPKFHFQRGGHAQDAFVQRHGFVPSAHLPPNTAGSWFSLLQSPGPRVPFPPSCPILAIDYVIGQHDGTVHRRLRANPDYRAIVTRAQSRLWVPFFEKLATSKELRRSWLGDMLSDV
jgi:hypothetical protein